MYTSDPSMWYTAHSNSFPAKGVSKESPEEANRHLREREKHLEEQVEIGNETDVLSRCKIYGDLFPDYLHVELYLNAGEHHGVTMIKRFSFEEMTQVWVEGGFIVWEDDVADNYFTRSLIWSFIDPDINTGNATKAEYRFKQFRAMMGLWD